jgi:thiamine-phosphate pyrophosphorylase
MRIDVRVYLVTDPACPNLAQLADLAVGAGATCVQLRDKQATSEGRAGCLDRIRRAVGARVPVLVDDDLDCARAACGLHVGRDDVRPAVARAVLGPGAIIGWSVGDPAQLADDEQLAACDYLAASPVWTSPTKIDADRPLGLAGVRVLAERLGGRLPLVAIGGIDSANAGAVIAAGADGVAVVRAICGAADPAAATCELRATVDRALSSRSAR